MSAMAPRRKGWCPGALRPMETGDGLLVRVRASGGRLTLDQAAVIAEGALACGNGAISLSARGNLQVRGVSEKTLADLLARLAVADLLDTDPEVERLRNILVSPLSDIDPDAAFDLAPHIAALESELAKDVAFRLLPSKFSFILDAGGRLPVGAVDADIRFEAAREAGSAAFAVYLAGDDALATIAAANEISDAASRLARAFLSLAGDGDARRMRALVDRLGAKAVFATSGLDATLRLRSRRSVSLCDVLGGHAFGSAIVVGAAAPFGALDAGRFRTLIDRARAAGRRRREAHALAIVSRDRARGPGRSGPCRRLREARLHRRARRSAASRRRLSRRAGLHARIPPLGRGLHALGAAAASRRQCRSARERLRQGLRKAVRECGNSGRDRERIRSRHLRKSSRPARGPRFVERRDRRLSDRRRRETLPK